MTGAAFAGVTSVTDGAAGVGDLSIAGATGGRGGGIAIARASEKSGRLSSSASNPRSAGIDAQGSGAGGPDKLRAGDAGGGGVWARASISLASKRVPQRMQKRAPGNIAFSHFGHGNDSVDMPLRCGRKPVRIAGSDTPALDYS